MRLASTFPIIPSWVSSVIKGVFSDIAPILDGQIVTNAGIKIRCANRRGNSPGTNNNRKEQPVEEHLDLKQGILETC